MAETTNFRLPLLAAGQAQKHVTVNEALVRLDALAPGLCESATLPVPPEAAQEGAVHIVPQGGVWPGKAGDLCVWLNGGWLTVVPAEGWRLWVRDEGAERRFERGVWRAVERGGVQVVVLDQAVGGVAVETPTAIPDKAVVIGVTGRVLATLSGPGLTGWSLGVPGSPGRYGSGYGVSAGSYAQGVTGSPIAYYADTPLLVQAEGGSFAGGILRLQVHFMRIDPPEMV